MADCKRRRPRDCQGGFEAHAGDAARSSAPSRARFAPRRTSEGLDGLVIPGGESTTIAKGIESAGLEPALRAHHEAGRPILGTCAGHDRLRRRAPRLHRRRRRGATPSAASCRASRPTSRSRGSATSRCGRSSSAPPGSSATGPGSRCSPPTTGTRWRSARARVLACAFHPELTDDPRFHAIFMAMTTARRASGRGEEASEMRDPRVQTPGEDPGRLLDRGEGGRGRLDRRRERRRRRCCWRSTRRC